MIPARRLRAFSLAAMFVAGQVAGFAHNLLVSHVTCPEHGEIIHSPVAMDASAHTHAPPCVRGKAERPRGHDHDICLVVMHRRDRVVTTTVASIAIAPPELPRTWTPIAQSPRGPPASIYRLAPKNSPPV